MYVKVSRRLDLVYGGGSIGLMGLVSQAVHRGGGKVLGYYVFTFMSLMFMKFWGLFFFNIAYTILFFLFWILVHRIIPRTLMCKEVPNLNLICVLFNL